VSVLVRVLTVVAIGENFALVKSMKLKKMKLMINWLRA
jgi:hypothetical protein